MRINERYNYKTTPKAKPQAIVEGDKYRFTILTSRLIRAEYSESGEFEDRATQAVINRDFPLVDFSVDDTDERLVITTENIELIYYKSEFSEHSLFIKYVGENFKVFAGKSISTTWGYALDNVHNLKGTARTLDKVDGECELDDGLMSSDGIITTYDDSKSLIIAEDGWIEPREKSGADTYIFCYGDINKRFDYKGCLKDFYTLCGKTPLLPKYALGNWWSRFHPYTQEEYSDLIKRFKAEDIPFSVGVIDMEWHYTKIAPKYGSGWTGYSWNKELFPNHKELLDFLLKEGLEVSLNLHPQQGVAAHEDAYEDMAKAMGVDPKTEKTIDFDITDAEFLENYFKYLHHPMEEEGVGFWWMDWQQGNNTRVEGLDPLWMLNHYHYIDNDRGERRPLTFSRYAGVGSHRYPIGFSGDTIVTWDSLDFQPYFTANAANVGYGWWSHDIGGHMGGYRDSELATRWIQLGAFSPINRLHSSRSPFLGKEPWKYNKICETSMKKFLKLRYQLMPYLYTMNYRASEGCIPLITPMYYDWAAPEAYSQKNEYSFGSEMIVKPITSPSDKCTVMGSTDVWLPDGEWYDFFTGRRYNGGRTLTVYRDLYSMPVFVKAGGIIPMAEPENVNGIDNPKALRLKVYCGADNTFELYEDDGRTKAYMDGGCAITKTELKWGEASTFRIYAPRGDLSVIPTGRTYEVEFIGIEEPKEISVTAGGKTVEYKAEMCDGIYKLEVDFAEADIEITINNAVKKHNDIMADSMRLIEGFEIENDVKRDIYANICNVDNKARLIGNLFEVIPDKNVYSAMLEILTAEE